MNGITKSILSIKQATLIQSSEGFFVMQSKELILIRNNFIINGKIAHAHGRTPYNN